MGKIRKAKGQTAHALKRMAERIGMNGESATKFLRAASRKGIPPESFPDGPLKDFLTAKQVGKRVRVHKGVVAIFNKTSDRAITAYRIPEEHMEEYEEALESGGIRVNIGGGKE